MGETLTIRECAAILRVSENMLRKNIDNWGIPYIQNGNRKMILTERFFREFLRVPDGEMPKIRRSYSYDTRTDIGDRAVSF